MVDIVDLSSAHQSRILGKGADGVARLMRKGKNKYVVKTLPIKKGKADMNSAEELINEKTQHLELWAALRPDEKQYFFKPYIAQLNESKYPGPNHTMEYLPGLESYYNIAYDLYNKTKSNNAEDIKIFKRFIRKVQKGVLAMWRTGLVHADMHLSNVLASPDGSTVKIIDFGRSTKVKGLNLAQNNLTTNKLKSPPAEWRKWWDRAIATWDSNWLNVYGAGNPEGYTLGMVNRNKFYSKGSFNAFQHFRKKVNTNAKFKTIPKPKQPASKPLSPGAMVPIANIVKKEQRAIPRLVDRLAAISKNARAQQKKNALVKINKEYKQKKKECRDRAKNERTLARKQVDKKFGLTPELRRRAQARANKVQKMVAIRRAFVKAAQAKKNIANRKVKAAQAYMPPKARKVYSKLVVLNTATKKTERAARMKMTEAEKKENDRRKAHRAYVARKGKTFN